MAGDVSHTADLGSMTHVGNTTGVGSTRGVVSTADNYISQVLALLHIGRHVNDGDKYYQMVVKI